MKKYIATLNLEGKPQQYLAIDQASGGYPCWLEHSCDIMFMHTIIDNLSIMPDTDFSKVKLVNLNDFTTIDYNDVTSKLKSEWS